MRSIYRWLQNLGKMSRGEAMRMARREAVNQVGIEHAGHIAYIAVNGRRVCAFVEYTNPESIFGDNLEEARAMFVEDYFVQLVHEGRVQKGGEL